jgi:hypothetical protein
MPQRICTTDATTTPADDAHIAAALRTACIRTGLSEPQVVALPSTLRGAW